MCLSLAIDSSETIEVIIIKLGMVTANTFLNHESNQCLIISETVEAMHIKFALKIAD